MNSTMTTLELVELLEHECLLCYMMGQVGWELTTEAVALLWDMYGPGVQY